MILRHVHAVFRPCPTPRGLFQREARFMECCSTCGQRLPPPRLLKARLLIDLNTNTVAWGETKVPLGACDAEMLKVLYDASPRPVTLHHFEARVLGYGDEERCQAWLRVRMCSLRRKLRDLPVKIITVYGLGYRLMEIRRPDCRRTAREARRLHVG